MEHDNKAFIWDDEDDDLIEAAGIAELVHAVEMGINFLNTSTRPDGVNDGAFYEDLLSNAVIEQPSAYDVEATINDLSVSADGNGANTASYYEEFGKIIESFDPCTHFDPCAFDENPLPELTFDDILNCVYEDIHHQEGVGGMDWLLPPMGPSAIDGYLDPQVWLNIEDGMYTIHEGAQYGGGGISNPIPATGSSTEIGIPYHHQHNINTLENFQFGGGPREPIHIDPLFTVLDKSERFYKKFNTQGVFYSLDIAQPGSNVNFAKWMVKLLDGIIQYFMNNSNIAIRQGDRIGMTLKNSICGTEPVYISLRRADQLSAIVVLDQVMRIFDSNKDFFLNGYLTVQFDHIQLPHGAGNNRVTRSVGETSTEFIQKKACFLKYRKTTIEDNFCLPYALVIGRAWVRKRLGEITNTKFVQYKKSFKMLRGEAVRLCNEAGVDMTAVTAGCSFDEVRKFQTVLSEYQIVIYTGLDMKNRPYTDSRYYSTDRKINIMLHENHYNAMRSITACFAVKYICPDCYTSASATTAHACKYACSFCEAKPKCNPCPDNEMITCGECNRDFLGDGCYVNHILPKGNGKLSVCDARKKCPICKESFRTKAEHFCGIHYCRVCEKYETHIHQCHMPLYKTKRVDGQNILYVFYDFETQQDTLLSVCEPNKFKHVPNLCVVQTACVTCGSNEKIAEGCKDCGVRELIYNSKDCVVNLIDYLVARCNEKVKKTIDGKEKNVYKFNKIIAIAHNMSGFDGQFILKYVYESDRFANMNLIINGTKAILISLCNRINFIDSLNYFQVGLSKLPRLFGFEGSKGFYCHKFNVPMNENYCGKLPSKHFYCPESMTPEGRDEFNKWYDSHEPDYIFDNKRELVEYCREDVAILRKACLKFAADFWFCNQIDVFLDGCTIAGSCNKVFRSKFLIENTIGIIPGRGYRFADNQSKIAVKWLCLVEQDLGIEIQHAGRGREAVIDGVGRVDGVYESTVFEFHGCWYHGHDCIVNHFNEYDTSDRSNELRLRKEKTLDKNKAIKEAGYSLVIMYECDFRRHLKDNPMVDAILKTHPMLTVEPLNPRDAFFGGRTNANTLYFKADASTKMHYYDICSLYPFVNKVSKCPLSHPQIHVGDVCNRLPWQNMDGLMKVTVLPPRNLDFPVLPTRMHSRLMFVLCNTCGQDLNQFYCDHNAALRSITGTWVMDEVKLAISKGYEIVKIHEIWEYQVSQYDPKTGTGGLFSGYINAFLKIKAEASGWPTSCKTPEERQGYIREFYEREGIHLDEGKIEYNPGLRQLAKTQLNSFWGRFGMRPDLTRTTIIKCYDEVVNKMFDHNIQVHSIIPINDDNMVLTYKELEEARIPDKTTNVVIAAFTASYARMELYKYLDMLGTDRVWYYDTDSILFSQAPGEPMPEKGNFLGQMTDELECYGPGSYIIEFVSGGPKNYAYKVFSPTANTITVKVKVKGITLNYENTQIINFDLIKNMVIGPEIGSTEQQIKSVLLENNCIRRTNLADVYTTRVPKTYRFNYTKRQRTDIEYKTLPYGY